MFQRAFSNISLPVHLFLLILVFVLRIPSFDGDFYLPDESQALLLAKKLSSTEGHLYLDAWYSRPPLMVWVYDLIYQIFGNSTLLVIRLLTCLYLYVAAVYFNGFFNHFKPIKRMPGLPAILFIFMLSVPWYSQEMNHTLLIILPLTISFYSILMIEGRNRAQNYGLMFQAGLWLTIGILSSFKIAFMMVGVVSAYFLLQSVRLDELFALVGGMVTVMISVAVYMYFNGNLLEFWDQGIMHYLDLIRNPESQSYAFSYQETLVSLGWAWGVLIFLAAIGISHFRVRFYSYVAKIRMVERLLSIWLLFGLISIGIKAPKFEIQDFILVVPPLAFYTSKVFDLPLFYRFRYIFLSLIFIPGILVYLNYWFPISNQQLFIFNNSVGSVLLSRAPVSPDKDKSSVLNYIDEEYPQGELWMLEYWPDMYHRLGRNCANKYTDHRLLKDKLMCLSSDENQILRTKKETERATFMHLYETLPAVVIDPGNSFQEILERFPVVDDEYELVEDRVYKIYALRKIITKP